MKYDFPLTWWVDFIKFEFAPQDLTFNSSSFNLLKSWFMGHAHVSGISPNVNRDTHVIKIK